MEKLFLMILSTLAVPHRHPVSICRYIPRPFPLFVRLFKSFSIRNRLRLQIESSINLQLHYSSTKETMHGYSATKTRPNTKTSTVLFLTKRLIFNQQRRFNSSRLEEENAVVVNGWWVELSIPIPNMLYQLHQRLNFSLDYKILW